MNWVLLLLVSQRNIDPGDRALGGKRETVFIFIYLFIISEKMFFHDPYNISILSIAIYNIIILLYYYNVHLNTDGQCNF